MISAQILGQLRKVLSRGFEIRQIGPVEKQDVQRQLAARERSTGGLSLT